MGYAADEAHRAERDENAKGVNGKLRFPLIEWGMTEADALNYCKKLGFDWGGLYEHFHRVSCYCCPLQTIGNARTLRTHYPELWEEMLRKEERIQNSEGFMRYVHVRDLDERFAFEKKQYRLFEEKIP